MGGQQKGQQPPVMFQGRAQMPNGQINELERNMNMGMMGGEMMGNSG